MFDMQAAPGKKIAKLRYGLQLSCGKLYVVRKSARIRFGEALKFNIYLVEI